jgi:hypothetical protein
MPFFRPYPARHQVPSEIATLFEDPAISPEALRQNPSPFFHLLAALKEFTDQSETHTLPLTSTLPDMKSDTSNYIHLQRLYKTRAEEETQAFKSHLRTHVDDATVDLFVKNAHALRVLRGKQWGAFDQDKAALGACVRLIRQLHSNVRIRQRTLWPPIPRKRPRTSPCPPCPLWKETTQGHLRPLNAFAKRCKAS